MTNYRYPPALNQVRDENADETWQVIETMLDGEINVTSFDTKEEAIEHIGKLQDEENYIPEEYETMPQGEEETQTEVAEGAEGDGC